MRTHHINIIPTTHKEMKPYNYKRINRFSRMSGKSEDEVRKIFDEEYAKLKPQHDNKNNGDAQYINDSKFDRELLSQLYAAVTKRLGIDDESLSFVSVSKVHGFNLDRAEKYLLDIGYDKAFVERLKTSSEITLIHYPKYLEPKFKKTFEYYFEKKMLDKNYQLEHPIVFYARTLASFITHICNSKKNPFSKIVVNARTVPISALQSLYKYKFNVVVRYVNAINGFKFSKFLNNRETFATANSKMTNFISCGEVKLVAATKFKDAIKALKVGDKLVAGKKLHFKTTKGVDLYVSLDKEVITIKYRIKIDPSFRYYGIKDLSKWIKSFVVGPCVKSSISLRNTVKDII